MFLQKYICMCMHIWFIYVCVCVLPCGCVGAFPLNFCSQSRRNFHVCPSVRQSTENTCTSAQMHNLAHLFSVSLFFFSNFKNNKNTQIYLPRNIRIFFFCFAAFNRKQARRHMCDALMKQSKFVDAPTRTRSNLSLLALTLLLP